MEAVAARAGTSKAVLYRRWPNRAHLALAAYRHRVVPVADRIPDTGDLREDVMAVLRHMRRNSAEMSPETLHGLLAELRVLPPDLMELLPGVMMTILRRAAERGEVDLEKVTPRMAALPGDLQRHQVLVTGRLHRTTSWPRSSTRSSCPFSGPHPHPDHTEQAAGSALADESLRPEDTQPRQPSADPLRSASWVTCHSPTLAQARLRFSPSRPPVAR